MNLQTVIQLTEHDLSTDAEILFHCLRIMRGKGEHAGKAHGVLGWLKRINEEGQDRILQILNELQEIPLATADVGEGDLTPELPFKKAE